MSKAIERFVQSCLDDSGDHEQPLGSNNTKYGRRFGENRVAWCVIYGYEKYQDAGVTLPVKTASCVVIYDACVRDGLHYTSDHCVPGDSVIRTWQHLSRNAPGFDPEQTHFQEVLEVRYDGNRKMLGLWGGNQGVGYVGPGLEWVPAGDPSILGGLAFHRLFRAPHPNPVSHDPAADRKAGLPAAKSHTKPKTDPPPKRRPGRTIRRQAAAWRRLVRKIKHGW